jgi:hypothetical protein
LNHAVLNPAQSADEIENLQYYLLVQEIIATSTSLPSIFAEYKTDSCPNFFIFTDYLIFPFQLVLAVS